MERRVVITGFGAITPIGNNVVDLWKSIENKKCGIDNVTIFDTENFKTKLAAEVKNYNPLDYFEPKQAKRFDRSSQFAVVAARKTEKNEQPKKTENKSSRLIEIDSAELERLNRKIAQNRMQDSRQENGKENIKKEKRIDNKAESDRQRNGVESNQSEKRIDNIMVQKADSSKTEKMQKKKRKLILKK